MATNIKLSRIVQGRTIVGFNQADNRVTIEFGDGSKLVVRVDGTESVSVSAGAKLKGVRQKATNLTFDFIDGSSHSFQLAEETSSVILRDANGKLEYAD